MSIEVIGINKTFGEFKALRDVTLTVPEGELVALLGPSGSGKTTLLRIIAGLEQPDAGGQVRFSERDMAGDPVASRNVGFVFQHYALFKHMTVFQNVAFGLEVRSRRTRPSRGQIHDRVHELLRLVQLDGMSKRYPSQLSGGQRQRVALARALAVEPKVLLLDEPFGALDAKVRQELRQWLRRLHDEIHLTSVFVTHDQEEALEVADRIVVMRAGHIEQVGTPDEVFHHPASEFVMDFLGNVNLFHGRVEEGRAIIGGADLDAGVAGGANGTNGAMRFFVRPHELDLALEAPEGGALLARVRHINSAGPQVKIELTSEAGEIIYVELSHERFRELAVTRGQAVFVTPREVRIFVNDYVI